MNTLQMTGRLVKDIQISNKEDGKVKFVKGRIACPRRYKPATGEESDFFDFIIFGGEAAYAARNADRLKKGSKILLEGEIRNNNYTGKDGRTFYGNIIVIQNLEFFSKGEGPQGTRNESVPEQPADTEAEYSADAPVTEEPEFEGMEGYEYDEDIELPFS